MAISSVTVASTIKTIETPPANTTALLSTSTLTWNGFDKSFTLTPTSTPAVSKDAYQVVTMSGGAATINLAALTGLNGAAVDMTGLKGRLIRMENPSTNTGPITVVKGTSNGFTGLGSSFSVVIPVGGYFDFYDGGNGVAVASGVRTLDITGTGSETLRLTVLGGS